MTQAKEYGIPFNFAAPYLDGVYLLTNAVPDAYLIYDAHDCGYYKAEKIAANHDLFSDLMRWDQSNRIIRTNLDQPDYIMGGADKLSKKLLQVSERNQPQLVLVARSNVVITAGFDAKPVIRDLKKKIKAPVVLIPDRNIEKDFLAGYLDALDGLLTNLPVNRGAKAKKKLALVGYLYDRNEGDHQGNINELSRMLKGIGVGPSQILLDGTPFAKLRRSPSPTAVVDLAAGWNGARKYARRCKAKYLSAPLPVGLNGTREWLVSVAKLMGTTKRSKTFIERELSNLAKQLKWLLPRFFFGKHALAFADSQLLVPLVRFLEELGLTITAVGSTTASETGYPKAPSEMTALREFLGEMKREGRADLIIGNSIIHQQASSLSIPFVELGYPSNYHHTLHPAPYLGFKGTQVLVERMINAMQAPLGGSK
jgi:nitrogenase molybdenum-iron protein alpha/beta subunit